MSFSYLASHYSSPDPEIVQTRFLAAEAATAWCLRHSLWVYSPIVHCHALCEAYQMPSDAEFWKEYNFAMLARSSKLLLLNIDGWKESKGVAAEIAEAYRLHLPIRLITPRSQYVPPTYIFSSFEQHELEQL